MEAGEASNAELRSKLEQAAAQSLASEAESLVAGPLSAGAAAALAESESRARSLADELEEAKRQLTAKSSSYEESVRSQQHLADELEALQKEHALQRDLLRSEKRDAVEQYTAGRAAVEADLRARLEAA